MQLSELIQNVQRNASVFKDATRTGNLNVILSLLGPAYRGLILQRAKHEDRSRVATTNTATFDWRYQRDHGELARLYSAAKASQWDAERDLDWSIQVDRYDESRDLMPEEATPLKVVPQYRALPTKQKLEQRHAMLSWMLSQFLHGEQGALFAACEVTEAVGTMDGKLYGSTQVVDEGRHVEVFHRYLVEKLEKLYHINDNLYTMIDALMSDARWDIKFIGMQIMIEGLALGAFSTIRQTTQEPLLRELLRYVITDEARHVHYGVVSLADYLRTELSERERREREDYAFEMALLMRNRFLAHEFYDEFYGHVMSRAAWDRLLLDSELMGSFRQTMFRRIVPNLKRIGLLTERIKPHYAAIGLLEYEHGKAAPELSAADLLAA